jgi:hypothetical protein
MMFNGLSVLSIYKELLGHNPIISSEALEHSPFRISIFTTIMTDGREYYANFIERKTEHRRVK